MLEDKETFADKNKSLKEYVKNLSPITEVYIESAFRESMSVFDWFYKADVLFENGDYHKAIEYFSRGKNYKKEEAKEKIVLCKILSNEYLAKDYKEETIAKILKKYKKYEESAVWYKKIGMDMEELILRSLYLKTYQPELKEISKIITYKNLSNEDSEKILASSWTDRLMNEKKKLANKILQLAKGE